MLGMLIDKKTYIESSFDWVSLFQFVKRRSQVLPPSSGNHNPIDVYQQYRDFVEPRVRIERVFPRRRNPQKAFRSSSSWKPVLLHHPYLWGSEGQEHTWYHLINSYRRNIDQLTRGEGMFSSCMRSLIVSHLMLSVPAGRVWSHSTVDCLSFSSSLRSKG